MAHVQAAFDHLVTRWVADESLRARWRQFLHDEGPPPDGPRLATPPMFRGNSSAGAVLEIRPAEDGGADLFVDDARIDHHAVPWHLDPDRRGCGFCSPSTTGARTWPPR
jgi:hypothetical protein